MHRIAGADLFGTSKRMGDAATEGGTAVLNPMVPGQVPGAAQGVQNHGRPGSPAQHGQWRPHPRPDRFGWSLQRVCSIMKKFQENQVEPEIQGHIFWSYARHSRVSEAEFLKAYASACPGGFVPEKPAKPAKELTAESPEHVGFHGKTQINYQEAQELKLALDEVLKPLTPEESANELAKETCLRDFSAGSFPIVEELRDDLAEFVAAGDTGATFEISQGQVIVAGKAIDCAVALGRGKIIKTALTAGGVGIGALALLFLL